MIILPGKNLFHSLFLRLNHSNHNMCFFHVYIIILVMVFIVYLYIVMCL